MIVLSPSRPSHGWGHRFNPCRAHQLNPLKYKEKSGLWLAALGAENSGTCEQHGPMCSTIDGTMEMAHV